MKAILYFVVFLFAYLVIGAVVGHMGWELPGTVYLQTPQGTMGFQLVQIVAANVVAGILIGKFCS